jgi:16S rRNA (cytidine1402-2'-O)-methyltransferase
MGELFVIGTPIGNLEDITFRALETLKSVDAIACEDTRHTLKLLTHYSIRKPLVACHANDEERAAARIVGMLSEGKNIAYCTDAGTPGLSDPGAALVRAARASGYRVTPIPGPSAFSTLVSVSGFGGRGILFDGFPSPKQGKRRARLQALLDRGEAFMLYESPFRVAKLMAELADLAPERQICIGREMTKIHESIETGTAAELSARFAENAATHIPQKGEFAILVAGAAGEPEREAEPDGEPERRARTSSRSRKETRA